MFVTSIVVV